MNPLVCNHIKRTVIGVISTLLFFGCEKTTLQWQDEGSHRWAHLRTKRGQDGLIQLTSEKTGVTFRNGISREQIAANRALLNGAGVTTGDVDGDGITDIYFCRTDGPNVLYRNLGGWEFEDITEKAGVACADQFSTGSVFADLDGDNDLDLLVTAIGGSNALFMNDGNGLFTEVTEGSGLASNTGATTMALADVDGDGDLDLYLANYKAILAKDIYTPFELSYDEIVSEENGNYSIRDKFIKHYTVEVRGNQILWFEMGEEDALLLNDGSGHFTKEPVSGDRFSFNGTAPDLRDWGLMARFQDVDLDGDPDLYVCNDFESPDRFYLNDGTGHFSLVSDVAVRSTSNSSMAIDFSDIERDGDLDFFIADMLSVRHKRRKTQMGTMLPTPLTIGAIDNRPQYMRNTMFLNRGDNTYAEIAQYAGLQASEWTWSITFLDMDLDGYEDVLLTTGHAFDVMDSDTDAMIRSRTRSGMIDFTKSTMFLYPRLETANFAFRNSGNLTFEQMSDAWGFSSTDISHGMALADFDNDGDLDVVVNRLES
ncbi:MAG TPA: VCBS repeat-containing protein, partial [Candidatus Marinimicrobia bacterium]|nr:VCBS repeat-containing protein [Candidatus Neomarinimicrobiota bacterium]